MVYSRFEPEHCMGEIFMIDEIVMTLSPQETQRIAEKLGKSIIKPTVITLTGDLGAGKTTFVQGLAKGLGVPQRIISPTFIIIREYVLKPKVKDTNIDMFYHVDLYRLQTQKDVESTGLLDIIKQNKSIIVILLLLSVY